MSGLAIISLLLINASAVAEVSPEEVDNLLEELNLDEAERRLEAFKTDSEEIIYLKGKLAFLRGDYERARNYLSKVSKKDYLVQAALNACEIVSRFKRYESRHFVVMYPDEKEEVYLEYLIEGLENGLERLSGIFGFRPDNKIRVEILSRQSDLERLTTLPLEAIEKTNTIAVTKFNKIMMSSPRTQIEGYDYTGTAVHELIHFMISSVTYERTPVWIHEALARYFDHFSYERAPSLRPDTLALLKRRYLNRTLISFEQIHPSMALLPSQEDTEVAFAEVFLVSEFLYSKFGVGFVKGLMEMLKERRDIDYIFRRFGFSSFKGFEEEFFRYLAKRVEGSQLVEHLYYQPVSKKKKKEEYLGDAFSMKYVRIGDLLFLENLFEAAYREYDKASKMTLINPHIENRKAFALINAQRYREAVEVLEKIVELYPDYYSTFVNLSRAYIALKEYSKAIRWLDRAVRINPFDKELYLMYINIFSQTQNQYELDRAKRKLEILRNE